MKKQLLTLLIAFFSVSSTFGQEALYIGDELYTELKFIEAIDFYEQALKSKPSLPIVERLANCYRFTKNTEKAEVYYFKAIAYPDCPPVDYYYLGLMMKANRKYDASKQFFLKYAVLEPSKAALAQKMIASCDSAKKWFTETTPYSIRNMKEWNSAYSDFSPIPYEKGYVFTSNGFLLSGKKSKETPIAKDLKTPFFKLVYVTNDTATGRAQVTYLTKLNQKYHDGPASLSKNGDTVYFTRTDVDRKLKEKINNLAIFYSVRTQDGWGLAEAFPYNDLNYSVGHPCISRDGKRLYFVSDKPGGYGGMDIYYCDKKNEQWQLPVNIGSVINTFEDELFPFIDDSGKLYFTSAGHIGMGGLDIFSSEYSNGQWEQPYNMRFPINSSKDDFGWWINVSKTGGFLSSNRPGGIGRDDIYQFEINRPQEQICRLTINIYGTDGAYSTALTDYSLLLVDANGKEIMPELVNKGKSFFVITDNKGPFTLRASAEGYFMEKVAFNVSDLQPLVSGEVTTDITVTDGYKFNMQLDLELHKIVLNKAIVIKNIYYDFNKWNIRKDASIELNKIVELMNDNPAISIQLGSHTDARGSDAYNMTLSQRRAKSAVNYIISKGISANRITNKGFGETEILNRCVNGIECSDEEHQLNRRTEFRVTNISPDIE